MSSAVYRRYIRARTSVLEVMSSNEKRGAILVCNAIRRWEKRAQNYIDKNASVWQIIFLIRAKMSIIKTEKRTSWWFLNWPSSSSALCSARQKKSVAKPGKGTRQKFRMGLAITYGYKDIWLPLVPYYYYEQHPFVLAIWGFVKPIKTYFRKPSSSHRRFLD